MVVSDLSLALMSALVHSFTQYDSLGKYLNKCFKLITNTNSDKIPSCYIRNDINQFVKLICQWSSLKSSKYLRTKQLFVRSMILLIHCKSMEDTKNILKAIFKIALSKYDGLLLVPTDNLVQTPCATSKKYLQSIISKNISYLQSYDHLIEENVSDCIDNQESNYFYENGDNNNDKCNSSFMNWASLIENHCKLEVETIEGEYDNAQLIPELVPLVIKAMELYPCWSGIMRKTFGYGDSTISSSRVESNFNQLKNRVFEGDHLPIRVDNFVEKLITYYNEDHLLLKNSKSLTTTSNSEPNLSKDTHQPQRQSAEYYIVLQPGFNKLDLNKKGSRKIVFLKNGNTFRNKPCNIPKIGKVVLYNSCSTDALLTIIACAATDSKVYYQFLSKKAKEDSTAEFIVNMLSTKMKKNMYRERILLLAPFFLSENKCNDDVKIIDAMDTVSSMTRKLLRKMPSYKRINRCTDYHCSEFSIENCYEVVALTAFNGHVNIQKEMDTFLQKEKTKCEKCTSRRCITVSIKAHVFIELVSLPPGKFK